jgi:hypothetical protein
MPCGTRRKCPIERACREAVVSREAVEERDGERRALAMPRLDEQVDEFDHLARRELVEQRLQNAKVTVPSLERDVQQLDHFARRERFQLLEHERGDVLAGQRVQRSRDDRELLVRLEPREDLTQQLQPICNRLDSAEFGDERIGGLRRSGDRERAREVW